MTEAGTGGHSVGYYARVFQTARMDRHLTVLLGLGAGYAAVAAAGRGIPGLRGHRGQHPGPLERAVDRLQQGSRADHRHAGCAGRSHEVAQRRRSRAPFACTAPRCWPPRTGPPRRSPATTASWTFRRSRRARTDADQQQVDRLGARRPGLFSRAHQKLDARAGAGNSKITADTDTNIVHFAVNGPTRKTSPPGWPTATPSHSPRDSVDTARAKIEAAEQRPAQADAAAEQELNTFDPDRGPAGARRSTRPTCRRWSASTSSLEPPRLDPDLRTQQADAPRRQPAGQPGEHAAQTAPTHEAQPGRRRRHRPGRRLRHHLPAGGARPEGASSEEVSEELGLGLLARIPAPSRKLRKHDDIALMVDRGGNHAEAYRKLRVALDFANLQATRPGDHGDQRRRAGGQVDDDRQPRRRAGPGGPPRRAGRPRSAPPVPEPVLRPRPGAGRDRRRARPADAVGRDPQDRRHAALGHINGTLEAAKTNGNGSTPPAR